MLILEGFSTSVAEADLQIRSQSEKRSGSAAARVFGYRVPGNRFEKRGW